MTDFTFEPEDRDLQYRKRRLAKWRWEDLVLHEDDHLLVLNKPQGIATIAERWQQDIHLEKVAREEDDRLRAVHRLDKHTTGVLLFARSAAAHRYLAMQFQRRQVVKEYLALVAGQWDFDGFVVNAGIAPGQRGSVRIDNQKGKPSETVIHTEKRWRDYSLLRAAPLTGRSHQIRVHLAYIHCPIVGDTLYGGAELYLSGLKRRNYQRKEDDPEAPLNTEYVLHSHRLSFRHPASEEMVTFTAPHSPNLAVCLRQLDKYNALQV